MSMLDGQKNKKVFKDNCNPKPPKFIHDATVLCISVGPRPKRVETRVIIKMFMGLSKKKKSKIADSKKPHFAKRSILNIFLPY